MWRNNFFQLFIFIGAFITLDSLSGCKEENPAPVFSPIPKIELVTFSPTTARQLKDTLWFKIKYEDGDGDLGDAEANAQNLFVVDNRINVTNKLRIPQLSPAAVAIRGEFSFYLKNTILSDPNATQETFHYKIYVVDRKGNKSNEISTPDITITP